MVNYILLYLGSLLPFVWGISHLFPTRSVVKGFWNISLYTSQDPKRIITMEWLIEGISLIFLGTIVAVVTFIDYSNVISKTIYWIIFILLNTLSVISLFAGFKINFLSFKLCPVIFTSSSILTLLGCYI